MMVIYQTSASEKEATSCIYWLPGMFIMYFSGFAETFMRHSHFIHITALMSI